MVTATNIRKTFKMYTSIGEGAGQLRRAGAQRSQEPLRASRGSTQINLFIS